MDKSDKVTRVRVLLASFATQAVVGFADYATGYELNLDVLYFIPISICAWHLTRVEVMMTAILGALTWGYADIRSGHQYPSHAYLYWNIFVSFSSLIVLGMVIRSLRDNLRKQALERRELENALADLRQSATKVEQLQNQLQVVCAWTKRIRVEGRWMTLEEFLQNHLKIKLTHGISPEAEDQLIRDVDEMTDSKQSKNA
jgi:K+-sensing histidine kinase KdpD